MDPVSILVVGAGGRGTGYANFVANHPDRAKVVAVAEPRDFYRQRLVDNHGIAPENSFTDWREAADRPRLADAVIIATQDAMHTEPVAAFAAKGYHILLEKPMAPTQAECERIAQAVTDAGVMCAVCHVMRYTDYSQQMKAILDSGRIGQVVSIQHLEPVGYWHQAHSFVRGNWRNETESSFMLLAKSCHDLDWLAYMMGDTCLEAASFGSLMHLNSHNRPQGATDRCLDCPVESTCPYSARKIYLGRVERGHTGWPVSVLAPEVSVESITEALRTGPYGRCVYACDNDVVDHQVVILRFASGQTASFTMTAFNESRGRQTNIFGTRGEIRGDGRYIRVFDFLTDTMEEIDTDASDASITGGHGGGDYRLMEAFIAAVGSSDRGSILSDVQESLATHRMVFAAERARKNGTVEQL